MKLLTKEAFEKSERFIKEYGRPLEIARFNYEFYNGSVEEVLVALSCFQNSDGGFGHALEADLRAPESSVLCTSVALQIIRDLQISSENHLVESAVQFLCKELNEKQLSWRIVPPSAENSPRAPWWYQNGREEEFDGFSLNPAAELLGYLYDYSHLVPDSVIQLLSEKVISVIVGAEEIEMHDLLCCVRLLKTQSLPKAFRNQLYSKISPLAEKAICCEEEGWMSYSLRPLQVIDSPESTFISSFEVATNLNLDYEIQEQQSNGAWRPTWSWDERYPNIWEVAKKEWTGVITLEKLLTLKRFDRIENV